MNKLKIAIFVIVLVAIGIFVMNIFYGKLTVSCARCHGEDGKGRSGKFITWEPLKSPMPSFEMSDSDVNDLLEYLKNLK